MKKILLFLLLLPTLSYAQKWIDTTYQISIERDSVFGSAYDFAGNLRELQLDIAYPTNDTPPSCGRPLVLVLYGGAWMGGDKSVGEVQNLMKDFAKRGYVAVAPNYRLGMFQTSASWNCNVSALLGIEWNCLNIQDTAEWYRAYYRAVQDAKGALRYMVNRKDDYNINPLNTFTTGFSAGGFTALGVAFLDHESEWLSHADSIASAAAPNAIYENGCVKKYGWDTTITSMKLVRDDLGDLNGTLNLPLSSSYRVRAVGNLFGGMLFNILDSTVTDYQPAIYGFHQPNDLIVPYKVNRRVFDGYSACAYGLCNQGILNRVHVSSSPIIRDWSKNLKAIGLPYPDFYFDSTLNYVDCAGQLADPSKGGHQLDNSSLRTRNMATFFASKIDTAACSTVSIEPIHKSTFKLSPNPANSSLSVRSNDNIQSIQLMNLFGSELLFVSDINGKKRNIDLTEYANGIYLVRITSQKAADTKRIVIQH